MPRAFHQHRAGLPESAGIRSKQFICRKDGSVAGGVYMWESQAAAEAFYKGPWRKGFLRAMETIQQSSISKPSHSLIRQPASQGR